MLFVHPPLQASSAKLSCRTLTSPFHADGSHHKALHQQIQAMMEISTSPAASSCTLHKWHGQCDAGHKLLTCCPPTLCTGGTASVIKSTRAPMTPWWVVLSCSSRPCSTCRVVGRPAPAGTGSPRRSRSTKKRIGGYNKKPLQKDTAQGGVWYSRQGTAAGEADNMAGANVTQEAECCNSWEGWWVQ